MVAAAIEAITMVPKLYLRDLKHVRHYAHVALAVNPKSKI
jgi:hypothetical protein